MSAPTAAGGRLWLVPTPLDFGTPEAAQAPLDRQLPREVIARAASLQHWLVENAKSARAFLKRVDAVSPLSVPLQSMSIRELPRPPKGREAAVAALDPRDWLAAALGGAPMGLLSEAGLPAVADPGSAIVEAAHAAHVPVSVLPGPNALVMALAASGCNGQQFSFVGYLPVDAAVRQARVRELEQQSRRAQQAQLVIETPYRNAALLGALVASLQPTTRLSVSVGLTLDDGWTRSQPVERWRRQPLELPADVPAVFVFQAA